MASEPFRMDSYEQMAIHLLADGSECVVCKPHMTCPCGEYQVHWLPVREPVKPMTMDAWMRGEDVNPE
jgi:hypothetical protein